MRYIISLPFAYLLVVNIFAFVLYALDKHRAKKHMYRYPESFLIFTAAIGGSVGALCAMLLLRHKTKHRKFTVTVPLLLLVQCAAVYILFRLGVLDAVF